MARYHIGLATARNGYINPRGGFYSRAGTALVGYSKQTGRAYPPRLMTFQFSLQQGICLEFGNLYLRFIINGAFVTETGTAISGVTQANPGVVHDVGHGYASGDWVFFAGIGGMTQLNGRTVVITVTDADHYSIQDPYGNNINTTSYTAYTSGGAASRIYTLTTPYAEQDLPWLKITQSADDVTICCWNQITGTLYQQRDLTRSTNTNWTLSVINFASSIAAPGATWASPTIPFNSGTGTSPKPTAYLYGATAVSFINGDESEVSPILGSITNGTDIALTAGTNVIYCGTVANAQYYNFYKAPPSYNGSVPAGSLMGYIGTSYSPNFVDSNIIPDFAQVPPLHQDPFAPGQIVYVTITGQGSSLQTVTWTITTAHGTGFNGYPVIINGNMVAFITTDNGVNYAPGDTIAFNGASFATGVYSFSGQPSDGDTLTLSASNIVWTFKTTKTASNQTQIQGSLADTLTQLAIDLNGSQVPALQAANYVATSGTTFTIQYGTAGTAGNAYNTTSSGANITPPVAGHLTGGSGSSGSAPSATLSIGPTTDINGNFVTFPSVVNYFQERRVFASSPNLPDTYWMTQPGKFQNMDSRVPTVDSDAISGSPWSVQVNGIQHMLPMPGGLIFLTGVQAWQLTGPGGSSLNPQPITPAGQEAQPQAFNGCNARVPPIRVNYDVNFVQAKGSIWRSFSYNFWANIYTGTDITYLSRHLFDNYIVEEAAWCEEPNRQLYSVRSDGALLSLTYFKEQDVMGWARHDTFGSFVSATSVIEVPVDALYVAVQRYVAPSASGTYFIERMDNRLWNQHENTWCVDCGLSTTPNLVYPSGALFVSSGGCYGAGIPNDVTGLVGGSNYSPLTTATIVDPVGTGCVVTLSINNGVIEGVVFAGGTNYVSPQLVFSDPTGSGSGAAGTVTLDNSATFVVAGATPFVMGNVGNALRVGGGLAIITQFISSSSVIANIVRPITVATPDVVNVPSPALSGSWSIAPVTNVVGGLWHLAGNKVVGIVDGAPVGPVTIDANGNATLPISGSLITLGLSFMPQMQSLYLDAGQPTEQGRRKKIAAVTVRMDASYVPGIESGANQPDGSAQSPIQVQTNWGQLPAAPMSGVPTVPANSNLPPYGSTVVPLYTGNARCPIAGGWDVKGQIALQQTAPLPMNVTALVPEYQAGDLPEVNEPETRGPDGKKAPIWGPGQKAA